MSFENVRDLQKKRKRGNENRNAKKLRNSGREYMSRSDKIIKEKKFKFIDSCCSKSCSVKISYERLRNLFDTFNDCANKELQDGMLSAYIIRKNPKYHKIERSRAKVRNVWVYCIKVIGAEIEVCRKFILRLFQISEKRLRIIQQKLCSGETMQDLRGKHANRKNKHPDDV